MRGVFPYEQVGKLEPIPGSDFIACFVLVVGVIVVALELIGRGD